MREPVHSTAPRRQPEVAWRYHEDHGEPEGLEEVVLRVHALLQVCVSMSIRLLRGDRLRSHGAGHEDHAEEPKGPEEVVLRVYASLRVCVPGDHEDELRSLRRAIGPLFQRLLREDVQRSSSSMARILEGLEFMRT